MPAEAETSAAETLAANAGGYRRRSEKERR
jgi:hypothetical protein